MEELDWNKEQLIEQFELLIKSADFYAKRNEVKEWRNHFKTLTNQERDEQMKAFESAEKEEEDRFEFQVNPLDNRWKELINIYQDKLSAYKKQKAEEEKENLNKKKELVEQLNSLVEAGMSNVGNAFKQFYEIRDAWQAIGQVNKAQFKELQYEYSLLRDRFYYNVGIHDQLKSYDFEKNAEQKQALIDELKAIVDADSIKKMEAGVKEIQSKWDEIGPTSNEKWEELKSTYWDLVNQIYEAIKIHYKTLRETQAKVVEEKNSLILEMEALFNSSESFKNAQDWIKSGKAVDELHQKWKEAGFIGRKKEEAIWNRFQELTTALRNKKNDFFKELKDQNKTIEIAKKQLIEKAENLKSSTDWKNTSKALIDLQKKWKSIGQASYKLDQELWTQFRAACDHFFTAKKAFFDSKDDRQAANLDEKMKIAAALEKQKTKDSFLDELKKWHQIGFVPKNKIKEVQDAYDKAVEKGAQQFDLAVEEIENLAFKAKVEAIKATDNAQQKIAEEKQFVKGKIDQLKDEILRFEENMSFFGPSKGAQKLKEAVEKRKSETEAQLASWLDKLKLLK